MGAEFVRGRLCRAEFVRGRDVQKPIKIACSVREYMQQSIKSDSILEQTFLDRER